MTLVITHPYVSSVTETTPSGGPGGNVGPSEWNANHTLTGLVSPAQGGTGITSGTGVTFFSSGTVIADSGTLTANDVLVGGGANVAPKFDGNFTYGAAGGGVSIVLTSSTSTGLAGLSIATSSSSQMQSDAAALKITGAWNNSATTYDAPLFMNITNTASASGSLLMDLQVGAATAFSVNNSGILAVTSAGAGGGLVVGNSPFGAANNTLAIGWPAGGESTIKFDSNGLLQFTSAGSLAGTIDVGFARTAANILAIANPNVKTTATGFQVYNTTDTFPGSPTNYERGVFDWTTNSNVLTIGTQAGGTGSSRNMEFIIGGTNRGDFNISRGSQWNLFTTGVSGGFLVTTAAGLNATADASISWNSAGFFETINTGGLVWSINTVGTNSSVDTGIFRATAKVIEISDGAANANGWLNWTGQARVTSNVTSTTTSFADITGMKVTLQASRSYSFRAEIMATCSSSGGIQVAASSTTTSAIPTIQLDGYAIDGGNLVRGYSQQTTLNSAIIASTISATTLHAHVWGTVTTTTTGASFKLQVAQQNLSATQTIVLAGSYMLINDTP